MMSRLLGGSFLTGRSALKFPAQLTLRDCRSFGNPRLNRILGQRQRAMSHVRRFGQGSVSIYDLKHDLIVARNFAGYLFYLLYYLAGKSAAQMATSLKDVRKRYPFIKEFATWNEVNIAKRPETVAKWWLALRRACPTCTILAADLLDRDNVGTWAQRFVKAAKRTPKIWGLHNYTDANTLKTGGTRKLLKAVKGAVWFTETGGVVSRRQRVGHRVPDGRAHAARPPSSCSRRWPSSARACSARTCITGIRAWATSGQRPTMTTGRGTRA